MEQAQTHLTALTREEQLQLIAACRTLHTVVLVQLHLNILLQSQGLPVAVAGSASGNMSASRYR
jgi:hypothetical protein